MKRTDANRAGTGPELPSNRKFGFLFVAAFAVLSVIFVFRDAVTAAFISAGLSVAFLLCVLIAPDRLLPLNRLWMQFGLLLGRVVSPVVLGVIFYGLLSPIAVATRAFGRDELRLSRRETNTHWRIREPGDVLPESFKRQF